MKRVVVIGAMAVALSCMPRALGQLAISYDHVFKARTLAGTVKVEFGAPVKGVKVEECTEDWKTVLSSTVTDENGHFSFAEKPGRGLHYLRLLSPGLNMTLVKVRTTRLAHHKELSLPMHVAT